MDDPLLKTVRSTLADNGMVRRGDRVVAAVSGGADSVCMLDILFRLAPDLGLSLVVAHFDHGLRKGQDASETRFVRRLARERELPFETNDTPSGLGRDDASLEERAREARYAFLERIRRRHAAERVAVAHTLDDQAETVLMRLLQGAGPAGLSGIPPLREPGIIRPLIHLRRHDIEAYLEANGLSWRIDPTNLETRHLRNRIRMQLLPMLLDYQPRLVEHLGDLADLIRDESTFLDGLAEAWLSRWSQASDHQGIVVPRSSLAGLPRALQRRVVRRAFGRTGRGLGGIGRCHVASVEALIESKKPRNRVDLPEGRCVIRSYDRIVFGPALKERKADFHAWLPAPGTYTVKGAGVQVILEEKDRNVVPSLSGSQWTAFLDAANIGYPLEMRPWRAGDRFVPLGMQGRKKVKDFLMDRKVSHEEREGIFLLLSRGIPVWLCGRRIDDRFKVTETTGRVLEVRMEPMG